MQFCCISKKKLIFSIIFLLLICIIFFGCGQQKEIPNGTIVIEGDAVESKVLFTLEDLKSMDEGIVEADYFSINSYGTKAYFHFKGISLGYLLKEKVYLKDDASKATFLAEDGYTVEYTLEEVLRDDYIDEQNPGNKYEMILAWEENGKEYNLEVGNPFRLVVGQKEAGDVNKPNWVANVKTIRID
jgi:DMSO/TMAO reductase YedYZ molybdopterin-dependent catalytic subunit